MDDVAVARVTRLIAWLKAHKPEAFNEDGKPSPDWLSVATKKKLAYWSDVLRIPDGSGKSFGARAARDAEDAIGIPPLHLEGAGWPFETVDQERFDRLSERQKGRIEDVLAKAIAELESEAPKAKQRTLAA